MSKTESAVKAGHGMIVISQRLIRDLLRLPANYEVVGMSHDYYRNCLNVYLQSDELPEVAEFAELPRLNPIYNRDEHGVVNLLRIDREA